jgi:hypothetical protein
MAPDLVVRVKNQLRAAWKFCLSIRKRDWELYDYPVVMREQEVDPSYAGMRFKQYRYTASIVNWALAGAGDTEREALQALSKSFTTAKVERAKTGTSLPRPGTHVPIQFVSQERVSAHPELAEDFIHRVLKLDWAWISDESSLWDFHKDETNNILIVKIKEVYGVDVSDIQSARLSEIFERIAAVETSS